MCRRWTRFAGMGIVVLLLGRASLAVGQEQAGSPRDGKPSDNAASSLGQPPGQDVGQGRSPSAPATPAEAERPERERVTPRSRPIKGEAPARSAVIREPSQGRPIFIMPGETFYFVMRASSKVSGDVSFSLRHAQEPRVRVPLRPTTPPSYVNDAYCSLVLEVPPRTIPGLYDLEVRASAESFFSRRSVKVIGTFKSKFRFVHLSNMNIGDLTAPDFDEMLPKEVNLIAPEFIIATGDYTEWARARDDAQSWQRVLKFFQAFNAPVFMLCGLHDHEQSFTQFVASKPIGTVDYGNYHGLLLLDHPGNPIDQDYSQLGWIETDLKRNRDKRFNFIAGNSDELALLDIWRERGDLKGFLTEHRIKMYIVGGSTDWDYKEFAGRLEGLDDFHFIRTHQASTSLRDRATGFSHYRVIEVDGDRISYVYANEHAVENVQHSVPTGRLRAYYDAPNDGTSGRVGVTVQNALNQSFEGVRVWLRVAKAQGGVQPVVASGKIVNILDVGKYWACDIEADLPDKGATRVVAWNKPAEMPSARPIEVSLDGSRDWTFTPKMTDFGLSYFSCDTPVSLSIKNPSTTAQTCWPVIRVNGSQLHPDRAACPRLPLVIEPGKTVKVPLVVNLRRVSPGKHTLQIYFLEDSLCRLNVFDVLLGYSQQASGEVDAAP